MEAYQIRQMIRDIADKEYFTAFWNFIYDQETEGFWHEMNFEYNKIRKEKGEIN